MVSEPYHLIAGSRRASKELDANDSKTDELKQAKHGPNAHASRLHVVSEPYHLIAGPQPASKELDANDGKDDKLKEAKHGHRADGWNGPDQCQHHYLHALCHTHTHPLLLSM